MASNNSNQTMVPQARDALNRFKMEAASEVGVSLKQALSENYLEYWELADYFDCSEKLIRCAEEIYREKGLL